VAGGVCHPAHPHHLCLVSAACRCVGFIFGFDNAQPHGSVPGG
jgi:hypothetical protein